MGQGFADETIVVIKLKAIENAVTYLKVKPLVSTIEGKGEGWNM
jgi:hypothetical protein